MGALACPTRTAAFATAHERRDETPERAAHAEDALDAHGIDTRAQRRDDRRREPIERLDPVGRHRDAHHSGPALDHRVGVADVDVGTLGGRQHRDAYDGEVALLEKRRDVGDLAYSLGTKIERERSATDVGNHGRLVLAIGENPTVAQRANRESRVADEHRPIPHRQDQHADVMVGNRSSLVAQQHHGSSHGLLHDADERGLVAAPDTRAPKQTRRHERESLVGDEITAVERERRHAYAHALSGVALQIPGHEPVRDALGGTGVRHGWREDRRGRIDVRLAFEHREPIVDPRRDGASCDHVAHARPIAVRVPDPSHRLERRPVLVGPDDDAHVRVAMERAEELVVDAEDLGRSGRVELDGELRDRTPCGGHELGHGRARDGRRGPQHRARGHDAELDDDQETEGWAERARERREPSMRRAREGSGHPFGTVGEGATIAARPARSAKRRMRAVSAG